MTLPSANRTGLRIILKIKNTARWLYFLLVDYSIEFWNQVIGEFKQLYNIIASSESTVSYIKRYTTQN